MTTTSDSTRATGTVEALPAGPFAYDDDRQECASSAREAIRALNRANLGTEAIPPPEVYDLLATLAGLGHGLTHTLERLSRSLTLAPGVYALYEDDGGNPEDSIAYAIHSLHGATHHATQLGDLLDAAQEDLSRTGYHPPQE